MQSTTFILGAGFAKAAGIPIQSELIRKMVSPEYNTKLDLVITGAIKEYLQDLFGYKDNSTLPSLEDMFTLIDLTVTTGHQLGRKYTPKRLRAIRRMLKYRIFTILDRPFDEIPDIRKLLAPFIQTNQSVNFVVLNWDLVLEKHLLTFDPSINIDYGFTCFDWSNPANSYDHSKKELSVCKMHGSLNWVYCDNCKSLFYDLNENLHLKTKAGLLKSDFYIFNKEFTDQEFDQEIGKNFDDRSCRFCGELVSSHIATFSFRKSFRTHAYPAIWYKAERLLAESDKWIFIGYSLPDADYEFKHLLKTAEYEFAHKQPPKEIEVVIKPNNIIKERFQNFFGRNKVKIHDRALSGYVKGV